MGRVLHSRRPPISDDLRASAKEGSARPLVCRIDPMAALSISTGLRLSRPERGYLDEEHRFRSSNLPGPSLAGTIQRRDPMSVTTRAPARPPATAGGATRTTTLHVGPAHATGQSLRFDLVLENLPEARHRRRSGASSRDLRDLESARGSRGRLERRRLRGERDRAGAGERSRVHQPAVLGRRLGGEHGTLRRRAR